MRLCDKTKPPKGFNFRLEVWLNNDLNDAESLNIHKAIKDEVKGILKKHNPKFDEFYKAPK